jgi:hypothetical protein
MGEISKLGWLVGLVEHAMWADSLYFVYLLLLSTSYGLLHMHAEPTWISLEDPA